MTSPSELQAPRLPLEVFYIVLDELMQEDRRNPLRYRYLTLANPAADIPDSSSSKMSGVCKAWYQYLVEHQWHTIKLEYQQRNPSESPVPEVEHRSPSRRVANLHDCLQSNPRLETFAQSLQLSVGCEGVYVYRDDPDLAAVCGILEGIPQLFLKIDIGVFNPFGGDEESHALTRSLLPIFSSNALTCLTIHGPTLPLHLFNAVPALREAAFGDIKAVIPGTWEPQLDPSRALPFRLRKVTFLPGDVALRALVIRAPEVFQELEELYYSGKHSKFLPFHSLLRIARDSLKTLEMRPYFGRSTQLTQLFFRAQLPLIRLTSLTELRFEFGVPILSRLLAMGQNSFSTFLSVHIVDVTFLDTLRRFSLTLSLNGVTQSQWDDEVKEMLFNPESDGWKIAKRLFGPDICPSLRELDIEVLWHEMRDTDPPTPPPASCPEWGLDDPQLFLDLCSPNWPKDPRDVTVRVLFSGATDATR